MHAILPLSVKLFDCRPVIYSNLLASRIKPTVEFFFKANT